MGIDPHVNPLGFLEGCFHLITPFKRPGSAPSEAKCGVGAGFPGIVLSTGMEDYYDSAYYFSAGMFQLPISGITQDRLG